MELGNGKGKGEKIKEVWGRKWGEGGGPRGVGVTWMVVSGKERKRKMR
jgi:hypothetical protein